MSTTPSRRWASIKEAADHLGVTDRTIRQMIQDGRLRGYRAGKKLVRVDLNELDSALLPFGGAR
ncbi:excisionase family DNA-binding protein [Gordonia paraffinivorans]|uniref:excisionase family DNA-binding protein n=1 Tax=Gordonia paraffinivorans TaxID=175628 RepID=UPI0014483A57|nr:excisionase family DNA-binding protein [Gordonia paraffinivorans]MCD2145014.1 excisionase family DNA-binding protein [Gordonia paraffinivorans]